MEDVGGGDVFGDIMDWFGWLVFGICFMVLDGVFSDVVLVLFDIGWIVGVECMVFEVDDVYFVGVVILYWMWDVSEEML